MPDAPHSVASAAGPAASSAPTPVVGWRRLVALLLLVEALAVAADLLWGGAATVSTEERFNAQAAAQLACGHTDRLLDLRYRPFCGGCSAEALAAGPLYRLLGPTVLAWKLIPAALHMLTATTGALLARHIGAGIGGPSGGRRAAVGFLLLVLGAPAAWRSLALTGFGNHAESMGFVLGSGLLLAVGLGDGRWWRRVPALLGAGLLAGFAGWFTYSAASAAVALALVALAGWRRLGPLALVGLPLGASPLIWHAVQRPDELLRAQVGWAGPTLAPADALLRWLVGDFLTGSLWPALEAGLLSSGWWLLLLLSGTAGLALAARSASAGGRWLPLAVGGFVAATALRYDLWDDNPAVLGFDSFNLRYRIPLMVMLAVAAALPAASRVRPLALGGALALALLAGPGIVLRIGAWQGPTAALGDSVLVAGDRADATVPEGDPPRRLARALGRPQDLAAAEAFLAGHQDPLAVCRDDHLAELGRRAAVAVSLGNGQRAVAALAAVVDDGSLDDPSLQARRLDAVAAGLARGAAQVHLDDDELTALLVPRLPALAAAVEAQGR